MNTTRRFTPVTFAEVMGDDADFTPVNRRLHRQALAWFEDHPGQTRFFRPVVQGEFTEAQEAKLAVILRGKPVYISVEAKGPHDTDSIPLSRGMYLALLQDALKDVPLIGGLDMYREHHCQLDD